MPHAGGRPSIYDSKKTVALAKEYLVSCKDTMRKLKVEENELNGAVKFKYVPKINIPMIEGLALYLGINRDTVYDWQGKYPEFSDIVKQILAEQAKRLVHGGLSGEYNPLIAKVLLTKHGYREGSELSGPEGGPVSIDTNMEETLMKVYGKPGSTGDIKPVG